MSLLVHYTDEKNPEVAKTKSDGVKGLKFFFTSEQIKRFYTDEKIRIIKREQKQGKGMLHPSEA